MSIEGMNMRMSGVLTPPPSEDGDASSTGCPTSTSSDGSPNEVNNANTGSFPPSPQPSIRIRNRSSQQREAFRSRQFTSRLQRTASESENTSSDPLGRKKSKYRRGTTSLPPEEGLKALEPPHEQGLTKMAYADQQRWITVQQKTFTKWYGDG